MPALGFYMNSVVMTVMKSDFYDIILILVIVSGCTIRNEKMSFARYSFSAKACCQNKIPVALE